MAGYDLIEWRTTREGYVVCSDSWGLDGPYRGQPQHRWVVEQDLGHRIPRGLIVHHKNQIRHDNKIENLEVLTPKQHEEIHKQLAIEKRITDGVFIHKKRGDSPSRYNYVSLLGSLIDNPGETECGVSFGLTSHRNGCATATHKIICDPLAGKLAIEHLKSGDYIFLEGSLDSMGRVACRQFNFMDERGDT